MAWHELTNEIVGEDIEVYSDDENVLEIVKNFNLCPFTKNDLSEEAYYIKAGFGNPTVELIKKEVVEKFPSKAVPSLPEISD